MNVIAKRWPAGLETLGTVKCLRVLTALHCGNQLLCSSANASHPSAGQWEGDSPSWFGVSASGDSYKLQMSLLKHLGLRQGEDIKTARTFSYRGEAQPGLDLRGRKTIPKVFPSPLLSSFAHPRCLGLLIAQSGPRQPFPVCPWKLPLQGLLEAVMKPLV